jgi:hypothetical protein
VLRFWGGKEFVEEKKKKTLTFIFLSLKKTTVTDFFWVGRQNEESLM